MASTPAFVMILDNYNQEQYAQYIGKTLELNDPKSLRTSHHGRSLALTLCRLYPRTKMIEDLSLDDFADKQAVFRVLETMGKTGDICIVPQTSFDWVVLALRNVVRTDELIVKGTSSFSIVKVKRELSRCSQCPCLNLLRPTIEQIVDSIDAFPPPSPNIQVPDSRANPLQQWRTEFDRFPGEIQRKIAELQRQVNSLQGILQEQMTLAESLQHTETVRLSPLPSPSPIRRVLAVNFSNEDLGECGIQVQYSSGISRVLPWKYPISPGSQTLGYDPQHWGRETIKVSLVHGEKVISNVLQVELT